MPLFDPHIITARQHRATQAFGNNPPLILIGAGNPIPKPGGWDQTYPFLPHPEYFWLTGSRRSGGVLAFDPEKGWTHFVRPVTDTEKLWEGTTEEIEGEDVAQLPDYLKKHPNRPIAVLGSPMPNITGDPTLIDPYRNRLNNARRIKDEAEMAFLDRAVNATAAGHKRAQEIIRPGISEREIQIELEAEMFRNGAHSVGYGSIVGIGTNAAVLHFEPSARTANLNDLVLIDAGGDYFGYTADVTRTYPVSNRFTPEQQAIYDIVLAALHKGTEMCHIGTEWHDVHRAAAHVMALGLRDLGILKGDIDTLLNTGAIALFFPHGIGHMVGLMVRDVGGHAPDRTGDERYCGVRVRVDLPLEDHFLMTVEPGLYFVPALLDDPENRQKFNQAVNWATLEKWRPIGGVRIEDNVLITTGAPHIITEAIPK